MILATPLVSEAQLTAMRCLMIDSVTASVVAIFQDAGIRSLLLKGPAIAKWLYSGDEIRIYGDIDLLVAPDQYEQAENLLADSGFQCLDANIPARETSAIHSEWLSTGPERVLVELHHSFHNIKVSDLDVWHEFSKDVEHVSVGGREMEVPGEVVRCLVVALHAGMHGKKVRHPLRDLTLALDKVSRDVWVEVVSLAQRLDAVEPLVGGLRLVVPGDNLVTELDLPVRISTELMIRSQTHRYFAISIDEFAMINGWQARVHFVLGKLFPSSSYMRYRYRLGDCGKWHLALAYLVRLLQLSYGFPFSLIGWWRARRRAATMSAR